MLRVFSTAEAINAVIAGNKELLVELPGDRTSKYEQQLVRNRVWQQVKRRGGGPVSVTVAEAGRDCTVFAVRCILPARRYSSTEKARIFLAVTVSGQSRRAVAARLGLPRTTVTDIVRSMREGSR